MISTWPLRATNITTFGNHATGGFVTETSNPLSSTNPPPLLRKPHQGNFTCDDPQGGISVRLALLGHHSRPCVFSLPPPSAVTRYGSGCHRACSTVESPHLSVFVLRRKEHDLSVLAEPSFARWLPWPTAGLSVSMAPSLPTSVYVVLGSTDAVSRNADFNS
jgi:hypothetical protein